jgi:hypothetical protein
MEINKPTIKWTKGSPNLWILYANNITNDRSIINVISTTQPQIVSPCTKIVNEKPSPHNNLKVAPQWA